MKVILSKAAEAELVEIWLYNARRYGSDHADRYEAFLKGRIDALGANHDEGGPVSSRPDLRQIAMRRSRRGYGHIAVYRVTPTSVNVLHVFHTAQDVAGRLANEP